ncbi:TonB-dependent receptor [Sphingorhabdus sp. M41]|uniref:TonB-dependent receptor n=1 Tax=Sphingorhabdus sp. M41 TaxID=1806885 RepID=UPI00078C40E3|nr:TonB-dependent receptor [Sphingorhabdus sp. M41]AMO71991.1 TonB-dependent receptor [Sphingorhabdus sp. M41]
MNRRILTVFTANIALASPAFAEADPLTDIIVTGQRDKATTDEIESNKEIVSTPDAASLVARAPGAALIDNGGLSGQVQYRGLFGDRILVRVNGQRFSSGGPNLMDPPLHYAPMALVDRIELDRGISPVRKGPGLGGGVNAILKQAEFSDSASMQPQADLTAGYRSGDNSYLTGGLVSLSSERVKLGVIASYEKGDDLQYPGGIIASSSFERLNYGAHAGLKVGDGSLTLSYRRQETDPTGNPPFPMDIQYFNTDFLSLAFEGKLSDNLYLEVEAGHVAVRHLMDNFSLRQGPASPMNLRATFADADSSTASTSLRIGTPDRHVRLGADVEVMDKDVRITNPVNTSFFLTSLNNISGSRIGGFVESRLGFGPIEAEIGARLDHHRMEAGSPLLGSAVPMGPRVLASAFAASDRSWSDDTIDIAARFWSDMGSFKPRLSLARKTRVANAIERFSWLPTGASGGLADGNIYVGDLNLKNEKAWIAEIGFDYQDSRFYARPTLFYRRVDDFIQGVPYDHTPEIIDSPVEMVANMNGDPTPLRFGNVDAEIYGADLDFGWNISGPLNLDGTASYVRAKRRDIDDNIYRIAPPNARVALSWQENTWYLGAELQAFADQNNVSATNDEQPSNGYLLAGLFGHVELTPGLTLDASVENLLNKNYTEHLAGYNRVDGSDVALGARLPGVGRSAFIRIRWTGF